MPTDPNPAARDLQRSLERQLGLYREVLDLSQQQTRAIAERDAETLMRMLTEKQKRIVQIDQLATDAAPLRETCEAAGDELAPELRTAIQEQLDALREVLAQIVELEDEGKNAIGGERDKAGDRISQMQKGKLMHKAYGGGKKPPPSAHFKDRNG